MAVMMGEVEVARKLMSRKFSNGDTMVHLDLNMTDVWGDTPLVIAASQGHVAVRCRVAYSIIFWFFIENLDGMLKISCFDCMCTVGSGLTFLF